MDENMIEDIKDEVVDNAASEATSDDNVNSAEADNIVPDNYESIVSNSEKLAKVKGSVEAILFSLGEAVAVKEIAGVLSIEVKALDKIITEMMEDYNASDRGIQIVKLEDSYQICTKGEYFDVLSKLVNIPKKHNLTETLMETLSIIAYKQPITRQEIEAIRGVSCVHAVNKLVEYKLIEEVGRLDAIGRPILFGTTEDFLRSFGVTSMDQLPVITPDKIEDFKQEAMEEVNIKVEI